MAETAGSLTDTLLQRARDPEGLATSRAVAALFLTHAQRIVNLALTEVLDRTTLTINPLQQLYQLSSLVPSSGLVVGALDEDGRTLPMVDWRTLKFISPSWPRDVSSQFSVVARLGRDLLVVYPASPVSKTITVVSVKVTADLTVAPGVAIEIPDPLLPAVLDLAEVLVQLQRRQIASLGATSARVIERIRRAVPAEGRT